jgi:hypothetical protein
MFWAMDSGALSLDTNWEDVNPTTTIADVTATVNDEKLTILEYTDGTIIATNLTGAIDSSTIPNRSLVKTARIGKGVTIIGNYAFDGSSSLVSISIPNTVINI